jgi:predicted GTPase
LKELDYDIVKYDAGDIRNKSIIDAITNHTMADMNVVSLFHKKAKPIAIVMDEIDGMNNGDKGGINSLIRIIRPKKTKKQKTEEINAEKYALSKNIVSESNQAANDAYQQARDQMHSIIQSLQSITQDLHSSMSKQVSMA